MINTEIDVLYQIKPLLQFNSDDDFYYLQILKRRKDNPDSNMKNTHVIKNYYLKSAEDLEKRYDEIKNLCRLFNARACLRLNKRSFKKVSLKTLELIAAQLQNDDFISTRKAYDHACGRCHNAKNKKWIIDIDDKCLTTLDHIKNVIKYDCLPLDPVKIYTTIETKSGYHLITKPFNIATFKKDFPGIDIHKDNPINLFIP